MSEADLNALRTQAYSLEATLAEGRAEIKALTADKDAVAARLAELDARLEAAGVSAEERARIQAEAAAGAAEMAELGQTIRDLTAEADRAAAILQGTLGEIAEAESGADVGRAVIDGAATGASIAFPQAAAGITAVAALINGIWGAAERRRRKGAEEQTAKVVRTVDAAKVEQHGGRMVLDTARLASLQDMAGVRQVVRQARSDRS